MTATAPETVPKLASYKLELYPLSLEQYQSMVDHGILSKNDKVELIQGDLVAKPKISSEHASAVAKTRALLSKKLSGKYEISNNSPIALPNNSQPEPDCVIALFREDFYVNQHPTPPEIFVVIEVAKSTLYTDRYLKAAAYAGAGIKEYWIINLVDQQLEVHLNPNQETQTFADISHHKPGETFTSPFAGAVAVSDLLPAK